MFGITPGAATTAPRRFRAWGLALAVVRGETLDVVGEVSYPHSAAAADPQDGNLAEGDELVEQTQPDTETPAGLVGAEQERRGVFVDVVHALI